MEVVAYGRSNLTSLTFHVDMPIQYTAESSRYRLVASVDKDSIRPGVFFSIESDAHIELTIHGEYSSSCFGNFDPLQIAVRGSEIDQLYFIWKRSFDSQCARAIVPDESSHILTITIVDFSGAVVGIEKIPFAIEKNGIHFEFD